MRLIKDEFGFSPIKRIDATIRGRVVPTSAGNVLEVAGSGEQLVLREGALVSDKAEAISGVIEVNPDGKLILKVPPAR